MRHGLNLPRLVKPYGQEEMTAAIASLMRHGRRRLRKPAQ